MNETQSNEGLAAVSGLSSAIHDAVAAYVAQHPDINKNGNLIAIALGECLINFGVYQMGKTRTLFLLEGLTKSVEDLPDEH